MKLQLPTTPKKGSQSSDRQRIAKALFCLPEFAMTEFRQMDTEDWKLHASRAWEVAEIFVTESKRRSK
jgi:hypothetical protein